MSSFDGYAARLEPVPAEVTRRVGSIDRMAGQAELYRHQFPRLLEALRGRARVESVEASSAIEGVTAPPARVEAVIRDLDQPRNRPEAELRGYTLALSYVVDRGVSDAKVSVGLILHLHRLLYEPAGVAGAGQFKTADNLVVEADAGGGRHVRFTPVSAAQTPAAVANLVEMCEETLRGGVHHPLIVVAGFILDFTIIHPFGDGNGRVSRLLANLLLLRNGYDVSKYVSLERAIERTKDRYYSALLASTHEWHEGRHDPWPWARYFLEVIETTYRSFTTYAEQERSRGSKQQRVRRYLEEHAHETFAMRDLRQALPGVSDATLRTVLSQLRQEGLVTATAGRSARWRWSGPRQN
jgi:Fic family protein